MTKITPGSTIIGVSGKKLLVDRVDGDIIYSGEFKIKTSAVVRVIPPCAVVKFKLGDRVEYIGDTKALQKQYAGILEVYEIEGDRCTCKKPSGSLTSWIELADLQLVEVAA